MKATEQFINQIEITAKVEGEITVRQTSTGKYFITFRVQWVGEKDKLWINCTWFGGDAAKGVSEAKPSHVSIRGRLITNSYESKKEGKTVYEIKIMCADVKPYKPMDAEPEQEPEYDTDIPF